MELSSPKLKKTNISPKKFSPDFGITADQKIPHISGRMLIKDKIKSFLILPDDC